VSVTRRGFAGRTISFFVLFCLPNGASCSAFHLKTGVVFLSLCCTHKYSKNLSQAPQNPNLRGRNPVTMAAPTPSWQPQEQGFKEICGLLEQQISHSSSADKAQIWQHLQRYSHLPDFNNYLAFIFSRAEVFIHSPISTSLFCYCYYYLQEWGSPCGFWFDLSLCDAELFVVVYLCLIWLFWMKSTQLDEGSDYVFIILCFFYSVILSVTVTSSICTNRLMIIWH